MNVVSVKPGLDEVPDEKRRDSVTSPGGSKSNSPSKKKDQELDYHNNSLRFTTAMNAVQNSLQALAPVEQESPTEPSK